MNEYIIYSLMYIKGGRIAVDKKQALKLAAYEVFSKKGYKATGLSEIAKQASMAVWISTSMRTIALVKL